MNPDTVEHRIHAVRERIEQACTRSGRSSNEVTLIGVSKNFPIGAVTAAATAGLAHFGENRVQELVEKAGAVPGLLLGGSVSWYMIGHLQRNKAKDVVDYADIFQALDSLRLAKELNKRASDKERVVPCLVQVNVSGEDAKYGVRPSETHAFLDQLADYKHLRIQGLMTIASFVDNPEKVRPEFRRLYELSDTYDGKNHPNVEMKHLSMGMSGDFEVAIEEGATHVRIGTAIFGARD